VGSIGAFVDILPRAEQSSKDTKKHISNNVREFQAKNVASGSNDLEQLFRK